MMLIRSDATVVALTWQRNKTTEPNPHALRNQGFIPLSHYTATILYYLDAPWLV